MNFDEYVDRHNTESEKWDNFAPRFAGMDVDDAVPMWLADMDFKCPPEVVEAVIERAKSGLYGYTPWQSDRYNAAVINWMKKRYDWDIEKDWIVFTPGVVPALTHAIQALTEPGDGVIIQMPVYYPFRVGIDTNGRVVRNNRLILDEEEYTYKIDFENLEELASEERTKMMILCSPHNPVGRVWTKEELNKICDICLRNNVLLVSDEIHADLLMKGVKFTPTALVDEKYIDNLISCYAPSKTFNMAGIQASAIIIHNPEIRAKFRQQIVKTRMPAMNIFVGVAVEAAWTYGEPYIKEVMEYIEANIDHAIEFMAKYTPKIRIMKPEGTYLVWVDLRGLGLGVEEAERFFAERAKIAVDFGTWFGPEGTGAGFVRMNFACHRSTLDQALNQLREAYEKEFA